MTGNRRRARERTYKRGGYTTDKSISVSKLPKGPGPGAAKPPKSSKPK